MRAYRTITPARQHHWIPAVLTFIMATGCGSSSPTPTSPTPSVTAPASPSQSGPQPSITGMTPQTGSTDGGAWATITGADFVPGARVWFGGNLVAGHVRDSTTISVSGIASHSAGPVDVTVTNPAGRETTFVNGYVYQRPEFFDFNGDWVAHGGDEFSTEFQFTVRHDVLVSVTCDATGAVTSAPVPSIRGGELTFLGNDGQAMSGTIVSPVNAVGSITVPSCPRGRWWADKR